MHSLNIDTGSCKNSCQSLQLACAPFQKLLNNKECAFDLYRVMTSSPHSHCRSYFSTNDAGSTTLKSPHPTSNSSTAIDTIVASSCLLFRIRASLARQHLCWSISLSILILTCTHSSQNDVESFVQGLLPSKISCSRDCLPNSKVLELQFNTSEATAQAMENPDGPKFSYSILDHSCYVHLL